MLLTDFCNNATKVRKKTATDLCMMIKDVSLEVKLINLIMADEISFRHIIPIQIRFSDVDQFGHMNNSVYFSLYDLAKTTYIKDVLGSAD